MTMMMMVMATVRMNTIWWENNITLNMNNKGQKTAIHINNIKRMYGMINSVK